MGRCLQKTGQRPHSPAHLPLSLPPSLRVETGEFFQQDCSTDKQEILSMGALKT